MCLAVPGEVIRVYDKEGIRYAEVRFGGVTREVCLHIQPDTVPGDFVLVHVGVALARIDAEEAARTLAALAELAAATGDEDAL